MNYNNGKNRKEFEKKWETLRITYREMGMSEEAINELYEHDLEQFRADRIFSMHNSYLEETGEKSLAASDMSVFEKERAHSARYWWLDEISDPRLIRLLNRLSERELEIITLYYFEHFTQKEIGERLQISQKWVSKCLEKIKAMGLESENIK